MSHALLKPHDPVHAAIERHHAAYEGWQDAPDEGEATRKACAEYGSATASLLATPCVTRSGAQALRDHLRWWLAIEEEFQPTYALAEARAADLTLFLGQGAPAVLPTSLPIIGLPPTRRAFNLRRAMRPVPVVLEGLAAITLIAGGIVLTGFASVL